METLSVSVQLCRCQNWVLWRCGSGTRHQESINFPPNSKLDWFPTFTLVHQIDAKSHMQNLWPSPFDAAAGIRAWNPGPSFLTTACSKIQAIIMPWFERHRRLKLRFPLYSMSPFLELFWRSQFVRTWLLPPTAISGTTDIHKKNRYLTHRIYVLYTFPQIPHHFPATWEGKISSPSSTRHRRPTITSAQPCVNQVTRSILCYFQKVEYCFFFILLLFIL